MDFHGALAASKAISDQSRRDSTASGDIDVATIPKPRKQWKPVKGRQASTYPAEAARDQNRLSLQIGDSASQFRQNNDQPSMPRPNHEQAKFKGGRRALSNEGTQMPPRIAHGCANNQLLCPHPVRDSPGSSSLRPRSGLSSGVPDIRTARTSPISAQRGVSAVHDFASKEAPLSNAPPTPKAGFLGHWLGMLNNKAPPSRAVTPSEDVEELTLDIPTEEALAGRQRNTSNISIVSTRVSTRSPKTENTMSSDHRVSIEGNPRRPPAVGQKGSWFTTRRRSSPSSVGVQGKSLSPGKNDSRISRRTSREKMNKGKSRDVSRSGSHMG